jgi:hypothetical protein
MSTTFTWKVANLERTLATGEITTVHYTIQANDDVYSAGAYGSIGLDPADPITMTPYGELDEFTVVSWVANKFGDEKVTEIEAALQTQLDEQRQPTKAGGLPWS